MSDQQKEIGTLVVVVLKAQHLHQPSFYKQDPYAQASLSGLKKRTKVAPKGGQHPVWDDELRFPVLADAGKDKANRILEVACYKDEQRGEDVLLGKGTVDIEETLKTGEFDNWVALETSAGTRGEVYLEMTFYANSPPSVTRRPSKLPLSDRLARPAQGQLPTTKTSSVAFPQPGRSPVAAERKSTQLPLTSGSQIPASLIPAHGIAKSQASGLQVSPDGGASAVVVVKHKDDPLPPLPASNDPSDVGFGNNPVLSVALHPGVHNGPRPIGPQSRNRVISASRPETRPEQLNRRTQSETPALYAAPPFSSLQTSAQSYYPETTSMTRAWVGSAPSIAVEKHALLPSPAPLTSPSGPTQAYVRPNSQAYMPAPSQDYPRTFSPSMPHTPAGPEPQQHYGTSPLMVSSPSHYQQYTQYPSGPVTPQPLSPPQTYPQLQQQQQQPSPPYLSQQSSYPLQPQQRSPHQQPYLPSQQQYHPQHFSFTQTAHPSQVPQPYQQHNYPAVPPNSQPTVAPPLQQLPYSQAQSHQTHFQVPPPPPSVQSQTPQAHSQPPHQPQPYFSPPPPPPPPLYGQGGKRPSIPLSVAQPSQTPIPPPAQSQGPIPPLTSSHQSVAVVTPLLQPSIVPSPSQIALNIVPAANTEKVVVQRQVEEKQSEAEPVTNREIGIGVRQLRETMEDVSKNPATGKQRNKVIEEQDQLDRPNNAEGQGVYEETDSVQSVGERCREEKLQRQEELKRQEEEQLKQQQAEHKRREEEEEERKKQEEARRQQEDEERKREDELRRREQEDLRKKEEERMGEERRRRIEEELRKKEERRKEEDRMKWEEEERRRQEEERRKREKEERIQREREDAEYRRKAAEEARKKAEEVEAERRWQEELARIRARAEQEAADAAFARAQMEAEEAERQKQEEANLTLVRQAQEEAIREDRLARERRRQVDADMEVARREQAHEEELERRRQEDRRKRIEEADRELARRLDIELNLGTEPSSNGGEQPPQRNATGPGRR